jgi:hypothetical protein
VVLLIVVFVLFLFLLFNTGVDELVIQHDYATFYHGLKDKVTLTGANTLLKNFFQGFKLHVVDLNLLSELKNDGLVDKGSITIKQNFLLFNGIQFEIL